MRLLIPYGAIFVDVTIIRFLLGSVISIDTDARTVTVQAAEEMRIESYDELIIATGSVPAYFGNDSFQDYAFECERSRTRSACAITY